jgi:hypothetical protein
MWRRVRHDRRYAGIEVSSRWQQFNNFLYDLGLRPSAAYTLDRIDNTKGYVPKNCRWATQQQQARNRTTTKFLRLKGRSVTLTEFARKTGVSAAQARRVYDEREAKRENKWLAAGAVTIALIILTGGWPPGSSPLSGLPCPNQPAR